MSECLVICGKLSANAAAAKDVIALDVDAPEHAPNRVNLTLGDISSRMVQDVPPVLVDLLELAVYVYCADQFRGRGGDTMPELGKKWRRTLPLPRAGAMSRGLEPVRRPGPADRDAGLPFG